MIKGITDSIDLRPAAPRIGKIHLGVKQQGQSRRAYPAKVDFFVVNEDGPSTLRWAAEAFQKAYGDQPHVLDILIPWDEEETFFPTARKAYRSSGLWCIGNGEVAHRLTADGITREDIPCPGDACPIAQQGACKPVGRFLFVLPSVDPFGVWEITTSSRGSIRNILAATRQYRERYGTVAGGRFRLYLTPRTGRQGVYYVLSLVPVAAPSQEVDALPAPEVEEEVPEDLFPEAAAEVEVEEPGTALAGAEEADPPNSDFEFGDIDFGDDLDDLATESSGSSSVSPAATRPVTVAPSPEVEAVRQAYAVVRTPTAPDSESEEDFSGIVVKCGVVRGALNLRIATPDREDLDVRFTGDFALISDLARQARKGAVVEFVGTRQPDGTVEGRDLKIVAEAGTK